MATRAHDVTRISPELLRPRLPCIGYIKIGGKGAERTKRGNSGTYRLPERYDHFVITRRERDPKTENFVRYDEIMRTMPQKPKELDILLMYNEPEANFQASLLAYDGKRRRCQGNGKVAFDRVLGQEIPCTCPLLKQHEGAYAGPARPQNVTCKPYGVLSVMLPQSQVYGGFFALKTTSWETISNITASLDLFLKQFGALAYIPMKLVLYPATANVETADGMVVSTTYKVGLVLGGSIDTAIQLASGAHERREKMLQLTGGKDYTPEAHIEQLQEIAHEDERDDAEEFYPENGGDTDAVQDAEFEIEDMDPLEKQIRYACEIAGADPLKVNQSIAKHEGRLVELAEKTQALLLQEGHRDAWLQAKARIEAEAEAAEAEAAADVSDTDSPEGSAAATQPAGEPLDLFS